MPVSNHNPYPSAPRPKATSWILAQMDRSTPGHSRGRSIAIILGLVAAIGWLDYLAGIRISLALFYFVPITLSVAWLGWRAACVIAVLSTLARIAGDLATGPYTHPLAAYWNRFMDLAIYWVMVWVIHTLISLWRQMDQRVRQRTDALEQALVARDQLQNQLFEISRRERSAIGHDLHDGLGQHLTATAIAANLLAGQLATRGDPAAGDARNIEKLIQEGIGQTRQIARGLLLAAIEAEAFVPELEELSTKISEEQHVACRFTKQGNCRNLDDATASHLFYIAQEAAHNAVRHARPTRLEINLAEEENALVLTVTDNGTGLPPLDSRQPGMGLRIMVHRTELIGGELSISPAPDGGTRVRCRIPLSSQPPASVLP
jgi:signal transduction histidine kinase